MQAEDLKKGELYSWRGRRARIDDVSYDSDGSAFVSISYGRKFEQTKVLHNRSGYRGSKFIPEIGHTWEEYKAAKHQARIDREHAAMLNTELQAALEQLGVRGCVGSTGELRIWGDLEKVGTVVAHLQDSVGRDKTSALDSLLG